MRILKERKEMKKVMYFIFRTGGNTRIVEVPITRETDKRITLDNKSEDYFIPSFVSVSGEYEYSTSLYRSYGRDKAKLVKSWNRDMEAFAKSYEGKAKSFRDSRINL